MSYMQKSVPEIHILNESIQITRAQLMLLYLIEFHFNTTTLLLQKNMTSLEWTDYCTLSKKHADI